MFGRAGVDHSRACYHENFSFRFPGSLERAGRLANDCAFWLLDRDTPHEFEDIRAGRRALNRCDSNALMADDDVHAFLHVVEFYRGSEARFAIDCNSAVHDCRMHFDLTAIEIDESLLIGGDVEIGWKNAVGRRRGQPDVSLLGNFRSMLPQTQHEIVESFARRPGNLDPGITLVGALFANLDLIDLEVAASAENLIKNLRQNKRIDNVAAQLDRF